MITISVDGVKIKTKEGRNLLEVILEAGIYVPHLCYDPDLEPYGGCRLCIVEINGMKGFQTACTTVVFDGMEVVTENPRINEARRMTVEFLLSEHNGDCKICQKNQSCELQRVANFVGIKEPRFKKSAKNLKPDLSNPFFVRDPNKCILCAKCVRYCKEIQGVGAIEIIERGYFSYIGTFYDKPIIETDCESCGECVSRCPVDAIKLKKFELPAKEVKTVCVYCGCGCGIYLGVRGNRVVHISGDRENPVNRGILCVKGRFGFDFINSPDRLKNPLIRRDGKFSEASWDEALNLVAKKLLEIRDRYGADSIAGISSAKCTNEENYLFQKFMRAVVGTNNVDHCARLCHAPSVAGLLQTIGSGAMTNSIDDIEKSECILVIGSNTTETHPIIALRVKRAVNRGAKLILIDPREIPISKFATLHLKIKPGTDVAVLNGIAQQIVSLGLENKDFISKRTEGYQEWLEHIKGYTPEYVEKISGVKAEYITEAAKMYARTKKSTILYAMGLTQHTSGTDNVIAASNLMLLCGFAGIEGGGINPLRGQNNVQGACDMAALPNCLPGYQSLDEESIREKFEKRWGVRLSKVVGLTTTEMFESALAGKLKAMYIMGENPMVSHPGICNNEKALLKLEFLVVQDLFFTETAQFAHVVLPACSFAEKDGTYTNTERRIQRIRAAIKEIGNSMPDWKILTELSKRMGYHMNYSHPSEIMEEISELVPIYGGVSYERLENGGIQWPCPTKDHPGTKILHKERFTRGLGKFIPVEYMPPSEQPDENFQFILTTGRLLYHYHTATFTRRVDGLKELVPKGYIEINPGDARRLGVVDGDMVKVASRRGEVTLNAKVNPGIIEGVVFIPFHFYESAANYLTNPAVDKRAKIPELKVCAVKITKV